MGLSASQARLLTITQRLNNNEFESQTISNAKVRLSTRNTIATEKYIAALDSTEMQYVSYSDAGTCETIALTFNSLMTYSSLKNQYNLYNSQGQLMVSEEDAYNFETSSTLSEFLMKNGLDEHWANYQADFNEYNTKYIKFEEEMDDYRQKLNAYNMDLEDYYTNKLPAYTKALEDFEKRMEKYNEDLIKYQEALNAPNLYDKFSNIVGTKDTATSSGSSFCYYHALHGDSGCYLHLLNHLLNYDGSGTTVAGLFNTTLGDSVLTSTSFGGMGTVPDLAEINKEMKVKLCDGDDNINEEGKQNLLETITDETPAAEEKLIRLKSDYYEVNGKMELKTLQQKAIDMYYIIDQRLVTDQPTMYEMLVNFTDTDMKSLGLKEPEMPKFEETEPPFPTPPPHPVEPVPPNGFNYPVEDREKAQWYMNLWFAMDGHEQTEQTGVQTDENANWTNYTVPDTKKTSTMISDKNSESGKKQANQYYVIIDKANATDSSWIQQMLLTGAVTMKQAALRTTGYVTWEGIEFSSTTDIREVQNDTKVAKAEAEYEESLAQIQAEDKILDAKNKKLDTEHSALKAEVDSIKNVMTKNIEKSFTAFS